MLRRVNLIVLLGLIIALVLSLAILAGAQGGSPGDALAVGAAEVGKPYAYGTEGPGSFSCTGLVRHILRTIGVDSNAPWDHYAYLSVYPTHATPVPGDVVVYPDGVGMYVGDNTVLMANDADQVVGYYPMDAIGTPLGFANPYGGASDPAIPVDPAVTEPIPADPAVLDPAWADPAAVDPAVVDTFDPAVDQTGFYPDPALDPGWQEPVAVDPMMP